MKAKRTTATALIIAVASLAGCASSSNPPASSSTYPASPAYSSAYGVVDSIQASPTSSGSNGTLGTVAGGVVGGVLGNQVGGGRGRTAATVAGAVGGAMAGNAMERNAQSPTGQAYQIGVRMDNGSYQTVQQDSATGLSVGSRVRVENGHVYSY